MTKLSLATMAGNRYRITLEESWQHERPEICNPDRIWYEQIPCQGGAFIGVYGDISQKGSGHLWRSRCQRLLQLHQ